MQLYEALIDSDEHREASPTGEVAHALDCGFHYDQASGKYLKLIGDDEFDYELRRVGFPLLRMATGQIFANIKRARTSLPLREEVAQR